MRLPRAPLALGVLAAAALAIGLAAGRDTPESAVPSVENRGPQGLAVLFRWLGSSASVSRTTSPLTSLPEGTASVVLAAPEAAEVTGDEVEALRRFVDAGGTLVYLAARRGHQRGLERWLGLVAAKAPPEEPLELEGDRFGATAQVRFQAGLTHGVRSVRVHAQKMIALEGDDAVPVASLGALWVKRIGRGEVWVSSGADLAENAHLDLLDNATFWANLATRGPIIFAERHHHEEARAPTPLNLTATALQLALCGLFFVAARGSRLGPPREPPPSAHRSGLEYVLAMASVTRAARVDEELVLALRDRGRQVVHERRGISTALGWDDGVLALGKTDPRAARFLAELGRARSFLLASTAVARLERRLEGLDEMSDDS